MAERPTVPVRDLAEATPELQAMLEQARSLAQSLDIVVRGVGLSPPAVTSGLVTLLALHIGRSSKDEAEAERLSADVARALPDLVRANRQVAAALQFEQRATTAEVGHG